MRFSSVFRLPVLLAVCALFLLILPVCNVNIRKTITYLRLITGITFFHSVSKNTMSNLTWILVIIAQLLRQNILFQRILILHILES